MAGINLLDQLKSKKSTGAFAATPQSSPSKFKFSLGGGSGEGVGLLLRVLILGIVGYGGFLGIEQYHGEETGKLQTELDQLQKGLATETRKKAQLKGIGDEMKGYTVKVEELQAKIKAVSQQETDRSYLVRALEYVATEMPKEVWFNEITASREGLGKPSNGSSGSGSTASFKGYALNAQAVSDLIQKLEASVYFPSTTLDRLELLPGSDISNTGSGVINVPPNSRRFQIMAKMGE